MCPDSTRLAVTLRFLAGGRHTDQVSAEAGRRIRYMRERRGWSQARLAEALGVSSRTVGNWERLSVQVPEVQLERALELLDAPQDAVAAVDVVHGDPRAVEVTYGGHRVVVHPRPGTTDDDLRRLAPQIVEAVMARIQLFESEDHDL